MYNNIILLNNPLEIKIIFDINQKISNKCYKYKSYDINTYNFIYKINKIDIYNNKIYYYGYYYHTSNINTYIFKPEPIIAYQPDNIESIIIILEKRDKSNDDTLKQTYLFTINKNLHYKFISHILSYSTTESKLSILIYYYLQQYLNINDIIINVKLEINNIFYEVNYDDNLNIIYNKLEELL